MRALYISYNGITEPITQSQVIPYLKGLSREGIKFCLLTFEKKRLKKSEITDIRHMLGLEWHFLKYHKRPNVAAKAFDIVIGAIYIFSLIVKKKIDIVHPRAIVAAAMAYPAARLLSKKFIFDMRGIDSEEYVDAGLWKRGGFRHKLAAFLEDMLIRASDHVVVLTERFLKVLQGKYDDGRITFSVIPCAVETDRFGMKGKDAALADKLGLKDKFVISYIGSLGTWYMLKEMTDFFKCAAKRMRDAHFLILTQLDKSYALETIRSSGLDMGYATIYNAPYDSIPKYLSVSNVGIFFIKPVFSKLSSSPVKYAEYLASGLPVIINSGIGDTDEITREHRVGVVVEGFDKYHYDKALNELMELLKDPDIPMRCRSTAERYYSLAAAVDKYHAIYKNLMTQAAGERAR